MDELGYSDMAALVFAGVSAANLLCAVLLYVAYKGYKLLVLVIAVVGFQYDVGLVSFALTLALILLGAVNERAAIRLVPWSVMILIPGVKTGDVSHPHQVAQDETGAYLIVSCQGRKAGFGQVVVFRIHWETGELEKTCTVRSREIAEPRHFVMCPGNRFEYGVNEKDYSVTCYEFDAAQGLLTPKQILPTLPDTYTGDGWASGIVMDPLGEYVVVSNRKHDSLTSFRIDPETGMLTFADCVKTGGQQPRFITVSTGDNRILAANELSDTLVEFELDRRSGKLMPVGDVIHTESPVCVIFTRPS